MNFSMMKGGENVVSPEKAATEIVSLAGKSSSY